MNGKRFTAALATLLLALCLVSPASASDPVEIMDANIEARVSALLEEYDLTRDEFNSLSAAVTNILSEEYGAMLEATYGLPYEDYVRITDLSDGLTTGNFSMYMSADAMTELWDNYLSYLKSAGPTVASNELDRFKRVCLADGRKLVDLFPDIAKPFEPSNPNLAIALTSEYEAPMLIDSDATLALLDQTTVDSDGFLTLEIDGKPERLMIKVCPRLWLGAPETFEPDDLVYLGLVE